MDQTQLSNPKNMESSAEMASTQMNNGSMPNQADQSLDSPWNPILWLSGARSPSQQTSQSHEFNPPFDQIEDGVNNTLFPSQPQRKEAHLSQTHQLNSLQCTIDGVLHSQQTNPFQLKEANQRQIDQSNSLPSTSGGARHSQQPHLTQTSQSQTDHLNFLLQPISGGMMHFQQTSQPQLSEACQSQYQLNSLQPTSGGARHPQQLQLTAQCQTAELNFLHSASGGMMHSQQTNQPRLSEACQSQNQLNSLQPTSGGVRNSQQSQLNRACQSQTNQLNSPQYTSGTVMQFRETRQHQLTQGEPSHDSPQKKSRSGKPLANSQSAVNSRFYRDRKRQKEKDTLEENEFLKKELHNYKQMHHGSFSAPVASLPRNTEENLAKENTFLKKEIERLKAKIGQLKEGISLPQLQSEARQNPYVSQSGSYLLNRKGVIVQDHHAMNLGTVNRNIEYIKENNSQTAGTCYDNTLMTELLAKIDADDESRVNLSDFTGLDGHLERVGRYSLPLSLVSTVERIIDTHGDISETSKINPDSVGKIYILFYATVKEMDDTQLEQLTEDRILKWRDAIKDALRIKYKVDFAMEHLKKIVHAYIGRIQSEELKNMTERISKLEADLNTTLKELAKRKERSKMCMDAAEEFNGKSLSLFP